MLAIIIQHGITKSFLKIYSFIPGKISTSAAYLQVAVAIKHTSKYFIRKFFRALVFFLDSLWLNWNIVNWQKFKSKVSGSTCTRRTVCVNFTIDCDLTYDYSEAPFTHLSSPGSSQGCCCRTAAGPTVTSRGQCFTQTYATFEALTQCLSNIDSWVFFPPTPLHFHSLPLEEWPWYFRKVWLSSVVLSF